MQAGTASDVGVVFNLVAWHRRALPETIIQLLRPLIVPVVRNGFIHQNVAIGRDWKVLVNHERVQLLNRPVGRVLVQAFEEAQHVLEIELVTHEVDDAVRDNVVDLFLAVIQDTVCESEVVFAPILDVGANLHNAEECSFIFCANRFHQFGVVWVRLVELLCFVADDHCPVVVSILNGIHHLGVPLSRVRKLLRAYCITVSGEVNKIPSDLSKFSIIME